MSRVLFVTSHFPPLNAAGVWRTMRFATYLPALGWDVHVLTLDPNSYQAGEIRDDALMRKLPASLAVHRTRAVYPLEWPGRLRRLFRVQKIARMPDRLVLGESKAERRGRDAARDEKSANKDQYSEPNDAQGAAAADGPRASIFAFASARWQRLKDAVALPLMTPDRMLGWLPFAVKQGRQIIRRHKIDVIYSSGPPWTNHLVGLSLKRSSGRPWVTDFRDPWVGADFSAWRRGNTWAARKHQRLERRVTEAADRIIMNTNRARIEMLSRYGDRIAQKLVVIPNGFDPADYVSDPDLEISARSADDTRSQGRTPLMCAPPPTHSCTCLEMPSARPKLVIAHAGSFYGKRNVAALIEAVGRICHDGVIPRDQLEIRLIGADRPGRRAESEQIARAKVQDIVTLTPPVPHDECLRQLSAANVLLLVQVGAPLSIPGKIFEYIALGKPLLALATEGATTDLIEQEGLGTCVDPTDVDAISRTLQRCYSQFEGSCGMAEIPASVRSRYDGRRQTQELDTVLCEVFRGTVASS